MFFLKYFKLYLSGHFTLKAMTLVSEGSLWLSSSNCPYHMYTAVQFFKLFVLFWICLGAWVESVYPMLEPSNFNIWVRKILLRLEWHLWWSLQHPFLLLDPKSNVSNSWASACKFIIRWIWYAYPTLLLYDRWLLHLESLQGNVYNIRYCFTNASLYYYTCCSLTCIDGCFAGLGWSYPCDLWSIGCILVELCSVSICWT